jgi:rod shape-determining protein MreD
MNGLRPVAATAAVFTALLLQAAVVAPVSPAAAASLPAVLVAAVAVVDGAAAGMTLGFVAGLLADLGSNHPAGVLALTWMVLGVVAGVAAPGRRRREDTITVTICCAVAASAATLVLAVVHAPGASFGAAVHAFLPALVGDALLALLVVPLVRVAVRGETLQAPHPTSATIGGRRD